MAAKAGHVYAIANDAMPGLVKIGATTRDPIERLHEARACTWAPPSLLMLEWLRAFKACEMELPPGDEHTVGSYANRAVALQTPEGKLREWVEDHYVHVPLRERDTGTKLEALYAAYVSTAPPVHATILGKIKFAQLLGVVYTGVGPHRNSAGTASGLYLLR